MGATHNDRHFHALIAGIRNPEAHVRLNFAMRWDELAGDALIDIYHPGKGGDSYILKGLNPDDDEQILFEISPKAATRQQTSCNS